MPPLLRSFLTVAAGFVLVTVLSLGTDALLVTTFPQAFEPAGNTHDPRVLAGVLCYVTVFIALGGYVTARLATHCPMRHALALGVLGLLLTLISTVMFWRDTPAWYHFGVLVAILPAAWVGGAWRERQLSPA